MGALDDLILRPPDNPATPYNQGVRNVLHELFVQPVKQAGQALRGQMTEPEAQDFAFNAATNLLSPGGKVLPAMFLGIGARTADRAALSAAQKMAKDGVNRETILANTGWFKGADDKWRFEIADNTATMNSEGLPQFGAKVSEHMQHPELFAAYPDLAQTKVNLNPRRAGGGAYFEKSPNWDETIMVGPSTPEMDRSVMLHELQHAIQKREGFAPGANYHEIGPDKYHRSAGEVEARNVQARRDLGPFGRLTTPPWATEDVPVGQQILRRLMEGQ